MQKREEKQRREKVTGLGSCFRWWGREGLCACRECGAMRFAGEEPVKEGDGCSGLLSRRTAQGMLWIKIKRDMSNFLQNTLRIEISCLGHFCESRVKCFCS